MVALTTMAPGLVPGFYRTIKSRVTAWLGGGTAGAAAGAAATAEPQATASMFASPEFWMVAAIVALVGVCVYLWVKRK